MRVLRHASREKLVKRMMLALSLLLCLSAPVFGSPQAATLQDGPAQSAAEAQNLRVIRQFHDAGTSIQKLRDSGLLADSVEWWVAGPKDVLPFAGTWHGVDGIAEFHRLLGRTMRYDRTVVRSYFVDGDDVAAIFVGSGVARETGRAFESEILRLYTLQSGKIIRVRNYYDTAAYVRAVQPAAGPLDGSWRVTETAVREGAGDWQSQPVSQGGLFVFSARHYSYFYVRGTSPRARFGDANRPTAAEKASAFDSFIAGAGTYTFDGKTLHMKADFRKNPNEMTGEVWRWEADVRGNTMRLVFANPPFLPGREWRTTLVRVE